jgi:hypothetical protein
LGRTFTREIRLLKSAATSRCSHSLIQRIRDSGWEWLSSAISSGAIFVPRLPIRTSASVGGRPWIRARWITCRRISWSLLRGSCIGHRRSQLRESRHLQHHRNRARRHNRKLDIERRGSKTELTRVEVVSPWRKRGKFKFSGFVGPARPTFFCVGIRDSNDRAGNWVCFGVSNDACHGRTGHLRRGRWFRR